MAYADLFASQKKIYDFAIERLFIKGAQGCAVLARIGSGKTRATLEIISGLRDLGEIRRVLLVAPLRIANVTWPAEIAKWRYPFSFAHVNGTIPRSDRFDITICSPDSLHKVINAAEAKVFDLIVVDEATKFKTWTTKRMKNMRKLLPHIPKRLILTGTLVANSLQDMFGPMFIVDSGETLEAKNITIFRAKYMDRSGFKGRGWKMLESSKQKLIEAIAPLSVVIQPEDYNDLPELVENDIIVELPASAQRNHATMKRELFAALENERNLTATSAAAAYSKCRQIAAGFVYDENKSVVDVHTAKIEALESIIEESGDKQILVFYQFTANADRIKAAIGKCSILCGGQSNKEAQKQIDDWFDGKTQIMLAQVSAAGMGLNLQIKKADTLVYFELPESGETMEQTIGRLRRDGGAKRIFMFRILAAETIDSVIKDRVEGKLKDQDEFIEGLRNWAKN